MKNFLVHPVSGWQDFVLLTSLLFVIIFIRYLVFSGAYHYVFFGLFRKKFQKRIINIDRKQKKQLSLEVKRSAITSAIFALSGTALIIFWQKGWTQIYTDWKAYPLWYLPVSFMAVLLIHETYYYWLHRWMHRPKIYALVHKWHHESIETNSLTAFSFHPIESVLQAIVVPIFILLLPMHVSVLLLLLLIMTLSGTVNHAGVEIYPKGFYRHWLGRWMVGATHHDLHHKRFSYNFGLYFTFWDKWMKTESPNFAKHFRKYTDGSD